MLSFSFTFPKSLFGRVADVLQGNRVAPEAANTPDFETEEAPEKTPVTPHKSKLNMSLDDLKTVSTALLYYRRNLNKKGEAERAEGVARIDEQFYNLIIELENQYKNLNSTALA
jgi:hypothetical protein